MNSLAAGRPTVDLKCSQSLIKIRALEREFRMIVRINTNLRPITEL